ncbi:uncharacterized protein LOC108953529 [Musa acuminata AAA Group]|uniref:uncharacterized protein LOC108953529 n=1 Tax=Musa acuminata AAA Group TaxID=214697 RepID=UPI0031CF276F
METDFLGIHERDLDPQTSEEDTGGRRQDSGISYVRSFNSAMAFLEQDVYHAAIHVLQGCTRGEAKKLSLMNTHLLDSNLYQPLMPLRPIRNASVSTYGEG